MMRRVTRAEKGPRGPPRSSSAGGAYSELRPWAEGRKARTIRGDMSARDIVVVGASAGGLDPLLTLVRGLPPRLEASLFVVMHIPATTPSLLPHILTRAGPLPCAHALAGP